MPYLFMRLEGALQSWGIRSKWDERDTHSYPSRSGIVGLIASGLGIKQNEDERIRQLSDSFSLSIRVDNPGYLMRDFQIIQDTIRSDGKHNPNSVISPRYYLSGASFSAMLQFEDVDYFNIVKKALSAPVWPPFLGRKACIPSIPILENETLTDVPIIEAICIPPLHLSLNEDKPKIILCYFDFDQIDEYDRQYQLRDVPVSFVSHTYQTRTIKSLNIPIENFKIESNEQENDHVI